MQTVLSIDPRTILLTLMVDEKNIDGTVLQLTTFVLEEFFRSKAGGHSHIPFEKLHPLTASILQTVFEPFLEDIEKTSAGTIAGGGERTKKNKNDRCKVPKPSSSKEMFKRQISLFETCALESEINVQKQNPEAASACARRFPHRVALLRQGVRMRHPQRSFITRFFTR